MKNTTDINRLWIVIAAYNEGTVIRTTIARVKAELAKVNIVVVDDCSKDDTAAVASAAGAHVVRHPINLGQGAALQTGIEYAMRRGAEYLCTFDADGQHDAAEIFPMLEKLQESNVDVALGSRFLGSSINMSGTRNATLKLAIFFTYLLTGTRFSDVHNGFRVMRRCFCENFTFKQNRMAHASEIQNYIAKKKISFIEFPVTISYTEYSMAKGQRASNSLRILAELLLGHLSQ